MLRPILSGLTLAALALGPAPGTARADALSAGTSFKRIGVPGPGFTGKRITVQIPLGVTPPLVPVFPPLPPGSQSGAGQGTVSGAPTGDYAWFWTRVSPDLSAADTGRFLDAVAAVDDPPNGSSVPQPRLQTLQGIAEAHGAEILSATVGTRISPALVLAVIAVESGGNPAAVSSAGAQGLMQLMPDTATRFGVVKATDPVANIKGGTAYLDFLMGEFGSDAVLALAGYNAGENAVKRAGGVPDYAETRGYVPKVLAAWRVARGLCVTPPVLPGDGCVFAVRTAANE